LTGCPYPAESLALLVARTGLTVAQRRLRPQPLGHHFDDGAGAAILGGPTPLLEPIHDHSAASASDESDLLRTA